VGLISRKGINHLLPGYPVLFTPKVSSNARAGCGQTPRLFSGGVPKIQEKAWFVNKMKDWSEGVRKPRCQKGQGYITPLKYDLGRKKAQNAQRVMLLYVSLVPFCGKRPGLGLIWIQKK
jgi:hypothetical protein